MKITCPYCGNVFNDTLEKCPSCGAPNTGIIRTSAGQPVTIAELQKWYEDRSLPSYETTRFFIGVNYKKPRAFGIYRDEKSGNYIVYKNRDNGSRAVRYEGTDEAYAVNEIYQRLKEEIIQQKRAQAGRGTSRPAKGKAAAPSDSASKPDRHRKQSKHTLLSGIAAHPVRTVLLLMLFGFAALIVGLIISDPPGKGYYSYQDTIYYAKDASGSDGESINTMNWYAYDEEAQTWSDSLRASELPDDLKKGETAKAWFIAEEWAEDLGIPSGHPLQSVSSVTYKEKVDRGYYDYEGTVYYHVSDDPYDGWYYFDTDESDWDQADTDQLPEELYTDDSAKDFYYTPTWDASTQITDFTSSSAYETYMQSAEEAAGWDNDNDDADYDWGGGDTWDGDNTDWDSDW